MTFSEALEEMKAGKVVAAGNRQLRFFMQEDEFYVESRGVISPIAFGAGFLLAEDWEVVE